MMMRIMSLASGIERIKRNSKYLSNREKQQMDEIYYMLRYMLKENISSQRNREELAG
jgi:hypothetical protein